MDSDEQKQGTPEPPAEDESSTGGAAPNGDRSSEEGKASQDTSSKQDSSAGQTAGTGLYDPSDDYYDDPYGYQSGPAATEIETKDVKPAEKAAPPPPPPPPTGKDTEDDDGDDDGMLRMSFMEHLEELRSRIIKALMGIGVAFLVSIIFANDLWEIVSEPAVSSLMKLGYENPTLAQIKPMEVFTTVWVKLPILAAIFLSSPWILYQVWAFIAPGLYRRERHWAVPFVVSSAGLFILGGLFAYFVAFRFGLTFLLGIGRDINITPYVSLTEYFDLFVNVTLGIGLVFEMPVLIFFLTLLRIVTPGFLLRNARYAVLIIVILAAIITPTPDVVNLMLFSVPMCLLYFVGIFAGYLLNLHRENRRMPWRIIVLILLLIVALVAGAGYVAATRYGIQFQPNWPFLTR